MLGAPELEDYSGTARQLRGASGEIRILVNEQGRPELIGVIQPIDDDLAVQMVLSATRGKYTPATKDGVPVATFITLQTEIRVQ
jgi:hypothetical protein